MSWRLRYQLRMHLRAALWPIPCASVAAALLVGMLVWRLDRDMTWRLFDYQPGAATVLLSAMVGATLTFLGTAFSVLLVVVQFASAQLTPRAVRVSLSDPLYRLALGAFAATFVFSLVMLARTTSNFVPQLGVGVAAALLLVSLVAYVVLVSHLRTSLRPVFVAARVGAVGRRTIDRLYRDGLGDRVAEPAAASGLPERIVHNAGPPGILVAYDAAGLVAEASRAGGRIALVPRTGDFVRTGGPLFRLDEHTARIDDRALLQRVILANERAFDEDLLFVFRILVDIAIRALSPGINDPTTAVMAIDQLHDLLGLLGGRQLDVGAHRDASGQVRLEVPVAQWEGFVSLAVDEIRTFGAAQLQVMRRLRAMLDDLRRALPEERARAIESQLEIIGRAVARTFPDAEDQARAAQSDLQGLGSSAEPARRSIRTQA